MTDKINEEMKEHNQSNQSFINFALSKGVLLEDAKSDSNIFRLVNMIDLLNEELKLIKRQIREIKTEKIEENVIDLDQIQNSINSVINVQSGKINEITKSVEKLNEQMSKIKTQKSTNFLDYPLIKEIEDNVSSLKKELQIVKLKTNGNQNTQNTSESSSNSINNEILQLVQQQVNIIISDLNSIRAEIGTYDPDNNTGSGLKNRTHQLFLLMNEFKNNLDQYIKTLSSGQEERVNQLIDEKTLASKIKLDQQYSISAELNLRIKNTNDELTRLIEKYNISDSVLDGDTLENLLINIKNISTEASKLSTEASKHSSQQVTIANELKGEYDSLNASNQQILENIGLLQKSLMQLSAVIGEPQQENTILGALNEISSLKEEFSENIQNINMAIGVNIPGQETGIHRLLKEAKISKDIYYSYTITAEQFSRYAQLNIKLPEYISSKGNSYIVRAKDNLRLLESVYDPDQKILGISLPEDIQEDLKIIILPILIEDLQVSDEFITGESRYV